jgi:hypothetical protein
VDFPYPVVPIIRHHHEQWDGRGYPDRLKGEQIPITARILSVVDCFDSVREDRPFRRGMTLDDATALLMRGSGTHFDPKIVEQFLKHLPQLDAEITALGLQHAAPAAPSTDQFHLSEIDLTQTRERGAYLAYDQIKKAHREVYALYEIARTFGTSLNMEHTLEILVDKVAHVVPFDTCIVYFYDDSGVCDCASRWWKYADLLTGVYRARRRCDWFCPRTPQRCESATSKSRFY